MFCFAVLPNFHRVTLCNALVTAAGLQDSSSALLATLTSSLLSSYSPTEVISVDGTNTCYLALSKIISLSKSGHVSGSLSTAQSFASIISAFSVSNTTIGSKSNLSTIKYVHPITTAVDGLIQGVQLGMTDGQSQPVSLLTPNVQISVFSTRFTGNHKFSTPRTVSQSMAGQYSPIITINPDILPIGGYAHVSVLRWSSNPYLHSEDVKSPLFGVSVTSKNNLDADQKKKILDQSGGFSYAITMQYSTAQKFDLTNNKAVSERANTNGSDSNNGPVCRLYNGAEYVLCKDCVRSSYTDNNVTFSCYNISQLLSNISSVAKSPPVTVLNIGAQLSRTYQHLRNYANMKNVEEVTNKTFSNRDANMDKYLLSSSSSSDDTSKTRLYGVLINSVKAEVVGVITSNPFLLNPRKSVVLLSFVGCLGGIILVSLLYLINLDQDEKLFKTYVKQEADEITRKLVKENIRIGDNGIIKVRFSLRIIIYYLYPILLFCMCIYLFKVFYRIFFILMTRIIHYGNRTLSKRIL